MRNHPPHRFVRFRAVLLACALGAWVVAFVVLALFKGSPSFPIDGVFAAAGIAFVWLNGAYWWLEMRYPHVEHLPGRFASRAELGSRFAQACSIAFFGFYGVVAFLVTVAGLRVAFGA